MGADGEVVWAEGFGWADLEKRTPVTPQTLFRTGGASIALTTPAAGLLLEKDRLHHEENVAGFRKDEGDEEPLSERCERTVDGLRRFADEPLGFELRLQARRLLP